MHDITLLQLFNDDIGISQQLLQLIKDEFQALGERNLPQLEQIIDSKMPLLSLLEQQHPSSNTPHPAKNITLSASHQTVF